MSGRDRRAFLLTARDLIPNRLPRDSLEATSVFGDLNLTRQIKHESYSKSEASADSSALELHRQRAKRSCARTQRVPRAKRLRLALVGSRLWCW